MTTQLLTVDESAKHLRVGPETIRRYIKSGYLKAFSLPGGDYRLRSEDIQELLQRTMPRDGLNGK